MNDQVWQDLHHKSRHWQVLKSFGKVLQSFWQDFYHKFKNWQVLQGFFKTAPQ